MGLPSCPVAPPSWGGHGGAGVKPADPHPHGVPGAHPSTWEKGRCSPGMSPRVSQLIFKSDSPEALNKIFQFGGAVGNGCGHQEQRAGSPCSVLVKESHARTVTPNHTRARRWTDRRTLADAHRPAPQRRGTRGPHTDPLPHASPRHVPSKPSSRGRDRGKALGAAHEPPTTPAVRARRPPRTQHPPMLGPTAAPCPPAPGAGGRDTSVGTGEPSPPRRGHPRSPI